MPRGIPTIGFFLEYLLLPILALLWAVGLGLINQKKDLLSLRQLLLVVLLFGLPMGLAGLAGLIEMAFMPWYYLGWQAAFLALGVFYVRQLDHLLGAHGRYPAAGQLLV
jgi:hypothetical protein